MASIRANRIVSQLRSPEAESAEASPPRMFRRHERQCALEVNAKERLHESCSREASDGPPINRCLLFGNSCSTSSGECRKTARTRRTQEVLGEAVSWHR